MLQITSSIYTAILKSKQTLSRKQKDPLLKTKLKYEKRKLACRLCTNENEEEKNESYFYKIARFLYRKLKRKSSCKTDMDDNEKKKKEEM